MATAPQPDPRASAVITKISAPRFAPYLAAAGGNAKDALRLYQWNIDVSGALYESLHFVEVVLRNAIDERLCAWNAEQPNASGQGAHGRDWLIDPAPLLRRLAGKDIAKAHAQAAKAVRRHRRTPGHPDVLAQLTFGTWRFLLPDRDPGRQLLWAQALTDAFPHLRTSPAVLVEKVNGIYRLRNRIAHLEPLLRSGLVQNEFRSMRHLLAAIDPALEDWLVARQRVTAVLRQRAGSNPSLPS